MRTVFERRASTILFRLATATQQKGGLFLLPANVCPVVPLALLAANRDFEFIDLDPQTLCMDQSLLHRRLVAGRQPSVSGVIFVRTYGIDHDATQFFRALREARPKLLIVDDRCVCRPEPDATVLPEEGADVLLFSTGSSKQVDLGFGGFAHLGDAVPYADGAHHEYDPGDLEFITTVYKKHILQETSLYGLNDPEETKRRLAQSRWLETDSPKISWSEFVGDLLTLRNRVEQHRAEINSIYRRLIPAPLCLPSGFHQWRFQVRVADGRQLIKEIFAAGFFAGRHYFPASVLFGGSSCPVANKLHLEIVNLFNDRQISCDDAEEIARIVARYLP